jgi:HlyD family secretion protein
MALSRTKKLFIVGGVTLLIAGIVAASLLTRRTDALSVQIEPVRRRELLEAKVSASGEVRPVALYNLTAEVPGRVTDIFVKEGDLVRKGQPLVKVDPTQQLTSQQSAEANYRAAEQDARATETQVLSARNLVTQNKAQLIAAETDLNRLKAQLDLQKVQLQRTTELLEAGVVSRAEFDTAQANYEVAKAAYDAQLVQIERLRQVVKDAEIAVQRAEESSKSAWQRVKASQAQLTNAQYFLDQTIRKSPIDGVVSSLPVRVGEFAVANFNTTPLMTIADMSEINVEVQVDETDIANVRIGQPAKVKVDSLGDTEIPGQVAEVGQSAVTRSGQTIAANTTSQEAKNFKVKIRLEPSEKDRARLRPGMSATAVITTDTRRNVLVVPLQALVSRDPSEMSQTTPPAPTPPPASGEGDKKPAKRNEVSGVFVEEGGKARFVPVTTGILGETDIEVVEGLSEGQLVVTGPYRLLRTLRPGTSITRDAKAETTNQGKG